MKLARICQATLPLLLIACASTTAQSTAPTDGGTATAEAKKDDDKADKIAELERKLDLSRAKLEVAQLEAAAFDAKHEVRMRHANVDVSMAQAKLAQFDEVDKPNKLATEDLSLQTSKDRAQEAAEELAQIEIMYKDQDLDDVTAEFVVSRGRRSAARAAKRLEIQRSELDALKERELPREREKLELAVDKATSAMADAEREGEINRRKKQIAVQTAENEVAKLEKELAKSKEEAKS